MDTTMTHLNRPIAVGRTAEVFAWENGKVLKLYREGFDPADAVYEHELALKVQNTGLPVPAVYDLIEIQNRRGIIYERVDGPSMLEVIEARPLNMVRQITLLGELHADMHTHQGTGLPSQRQRLIHKLNGAALLPGMLKEAALEALNNLPDGNKVCHGDFHPGNILMTTAGAIVIDWIDASCGNPIADVARTLVLIKAAHLPSNSLFGWLVRLGRQSITANYLRSYFKHAQDERQQLKTWFPIIAAARLSENIPQENDRLLEMARSGFELRP